MGIGDWGFGGLGPIPNPQISMKCNIIIFLIIKDNKF